jgi:hypothetical protein
MTMNKLIAFANSKDLEVIAVRVIVAIVTVATAVICFSALTA